MDLVNLITELEDCLQLYGNKNVYVRDHFGQLELATEVIESGHSNEENTVIAIIV